MASRTCRQSQGFTLIELLIVVAIIAILAAIAAPNCLEAQTRAKLSPVRAEIIDLVWFLDGTQTAAQEESLLATFSLTATTVVVPDDGGSIATGAFRDPDGTDVWEPYAFVSEAGN